MSRSLLAVKKQFRRLVAEHEQVITNVAIRSVKILNNAVTTNGVKLAVGKYL